ncbi:MAG: exodeoxyribonuclease VII small subunit [Bacteroidota bacterium]
MKINDKLTYEEAMQRLKEIVGELERKEVKIDVLSATVSEAKSLVEFCREKLDSTEDDIKKIIDPEEEDQE